MNVIKKTKETNLKKYGSVNFFTTEQFKDKRKETLLEKYGTDVPLKNKDCLSKQKLTCKERYGVENFAQHPQH